MLLVQRRQTLARAILQPRQPLLQRMAT